MRLRWRTFWFLVGGWLLLGGLCLVWRLPDQGFFRLALHPLDLPRALDEGARPCHVATDDGPGANGFCMTPLRVRGTANQISVWSSGQHVPGRLLGGGDSGMSGLFGYRAFDLAKGSALAGEDNLGETEVRFDILSVAWNHVETTFAAAGKTFTVRTVVISQPLFDEEAFDQCISDPGERERMEKAGEIFPGVRVRRGDVARGASKRSLDREGGAAPSPLRAAGPVRRL